MKVNGYGNIKPGSSVRKRGSTSGTSDSFSDLLEAAKSESALPTQAIEGASATAPLGGLLALQEISEEERKRQQAVKQGNNMLDSLETLRQRLLIGEIPAHMLSELSERLGRQKEQVADPQLMLIIEDIELRVAVELAKLEMSFASHSHI